MLTMVLMVPAFGSIVTKAANDLDRAWSFSLQANSGVYSLSDFRIKEDDSSIYVKTDAMSGTLSSVYFKAYGARDIYGTNYADCTYGGRNYYVSYSGTRYVMWNTVYESKDANGNRLYNAAALAGRSKVGTGTASGYWSPDTTGIYSHMPY